jgi:hypothetical protein
MQVDMNRNRLYHSNEYSLLSFFADHGVDEDVDVEWAFCITSTDTCNLGPK